jgi:acetyl esterase/lipase
MSVTYDHRSLPEETRSEILAEQQMNQFDPDHLPEGVPPSQLLAGPPATLPDGVTTGRVMINGIPGTNLSSKGAPTDTVLMHIHGGGFVFGSSDDALTFMSGLKVELGLDSYSVDYSLAPAKKFPVQIDECLAFYMGLYELGYHRIFLAGESAGGNLCVALALKLISLGLPLPGAVISASGVYDFSDAIPGKPDDMFHRCIPSFVADYVGSENPKNPLISPIYGDFSGFPPLLLQCGTEESLMLDSVELANIVEKTDCDCTLSIWEGAGHAFSIANMDCYFSREGMKQIFSFIKQHL